MTDNSANETTLKIGDRMPDGTIYAGVSPETGKPMYATPADAPLTCTFNQAQKYAEELDAHGHKDWRAPTKGELNVLFENRNKGELKGTFNGTGSDPAGWYWSAADFGEHRQFDDFEAWAQRFSDGYQTSTYKILGSSLRCVR